MGIDIFGFIYKRSLDRQMSLNLNEWMNEWIQEWSAQAQYQQTFNFKPCLLVRPLYEFLYFDCAIKYL